jgi:CBS domain-containing protein
VTAMPVTSPALRPLADLASISVRRIMRPGVVSVAANATLLQVAQVMSDHRVHAVLVLNSSTAGPVGWVTSGGLIARLADDPFAHAGEAITESPTRIAPHARMADAIRALQPPGVTHLIVANGPAAMPMGIVSDTDIIRFAASRA